MRVKDDCRDEIMKRMTRMSGLRIPLPQNLTPVQGTKGGARVKLYQLPSPVPSSCCSESTQHLPPSVTSMTAWKYTRSTSPALLIGHWASSATLWMSRVSTLEPTRANFWMVEVMPCRQMSARMSV